MSTLLLLLSLFAFSAASYGEVGKSSEAAVPASGSASIASNPYSGMPEGLSALDQTQAGRGTPADRVCLNIHAFIFKTSDDRVPQLVRETTCMPASRAGTKKVNENAQPKLVPATGGNSF
jgi:hypothetical protein